MPERPLSIFSNPKGRPANGHGKEINIRINIEKYPHIVELLKTRNQEDFERIFNFKLAGKYRWKTIKHRLIGILDTIAQQEKKECNKKVH